MLPRLLACSTTLLVTGTLLLVERSQFAPSADAPQQALVAQNEQAQPPTRQRRAQAPPADAPRMAADFVEALLQAARAGGAEVLSEGDSYDDFASIAKLRDGTLVAAYAAYYNGHDQLRLHRQLANGRWSTRTNVPLAQARADIWMPQVAVDAQDRIWVVWCEQTGQSTGKTGNWDLYARAIEGDAWGKLMRLTDDPRPDINPHVFSDAAGNIHVVWQAHPQNNGDVQYCRFDGKSWSKPLAITADGESDWYPRGAVDAQGTVWIAFDSYRNGDYDVFLTNVNGNQLGPVTTIAASGYYEAHPSVACTPDGRVWVSWEQGGFNWGKDQGYWLKRESRDQGSTLGSTRDVKVACVDRGKILAAPDVAAAIPAAAPSKSTMFPELAAGTDGSLWLRCRHLVHGARPAGGFSRGWTESVTCLTTAGWQPFVELPASAGRSSVFSRVCPTNDGALAVAYSSDARAVQNYHRPIQDNVMVARVAKPVEAPGSPDMLPLVAPAAPAGIPPWNVSREAKEVAAIRQHRVTIDGRAHRIVRGDLHRHTELSWDVGPGNDGSYLDFYRYMIDVASMDFGGITDHQGGGHYAYWWWLIEKSCDMYYLSPRFTPLYGYERSVTFPNGHRNIFHTYRGVPVFAFQLKTNQTGVFPGTSPPRGAVVDNDTKLLYEHLRASGGIAISHTSGTSSMGTDWRDNDPEVEPVVEIYQGARNSYEALGAPRVHSIDEAPEKAPGGFQKEGMLWNAYAKGYRLGTISASDHGSTHISYALVYTPENDRQPIIDSIRKRHTYGSTGNLIVALEANGRFMGDEFKTTEMPSLTLRATGTAKIVEVRVVRNNEYVYTSQPDKAEFELTYVDMASQPGTNMYYCRLLQEDGEIAWTSPVWVNRPQ